MITEQIRSREVSAGGKDRRRSPRPMHLVQSTKKSPNRGETDSINQDVR